jgi:hypothetical protein
VSGLSSTRRWLIAAATLVVVFALATWATTPSTVIVPSAPVWARCFDPIALPMPAEATEIALVRHQSFAPPKLVASPPSMTQVQMEERPPSRAADGQKVTLPIGQSLILPPGATWPVSLREGSLELRRPDGSRFLIDPRARFALHPAETYTARLAAPVEVATISQDGNVQLPPAAKVEIVVPNGEPTGAPLVVRQSERLLVSALVLPATTSTFSPDVHPSQEAAPYLAVRLAAPGLDLDPSKRTLRACLWLGEDQPQPIPITRVGPSARGVADLMLGLPSAPFPWVDWQRGRMASLAVISTDGTYAGTGSFVYPSRSWAFLLATGLTVGLSWGLVWLRNAGSSWKTWSMGLFLGEDGQPSLSLLQILLWTIVTIWALLFVFFNTGNLLTMTQQVMVLLGFAGVGSLSARWIASGQRSPSTGAANVAEPRFWAVLENNGQLDLFKLQLFLFTLLIATYVAFRVAGQSAFPAIDAEFLLLMGVSNGLYVGSKFGQPTPLAQANARKLEWDTLRLRTQDLEGEVADLKAQSDALATRIADPNTDAALKQNLTDQKALIDKKLADKTVELAQARIDRDAKEIAYKDAVKALGAA